MVRAGAGVVLRHWILVTTATLETVIVILHTNILWETLAASLLELRGTGQDTAACGVILIKIYTSVCSPKQTKNTNT